LPRQLEDVLDYLLPRSSSLELPAHRAGRPASLPILTVPFPADDVLRAALVYNLAVSLARTGLQVSVVVPDSGNACDSWPDLDPQPLGLQLILAKAQELAEIGRAALDVAVGRLPDARDGGVVLACVPSAWIFETERPARALLRWCLLLSLPDGNSLRSCYAMAKRVCALESGARVGVTLHGVRSLRQAALAFERVARVAATQLGVRLESYGLLVDDLHVYRSIAARRSVALAHPQAPAALALAEVATLIGADSRELCRV